MYELKHRKNKLAERVNFLQYSKSTNLINIRQTRKSRHGRIYIEKAIVPRSASAPNCSRFQCG